MRYNTIYFTIVYTYLPHFRKYKNRSRLDYWSLIDANKIKGSDGTIFPPNIKSKETLPIFSADFCRSVEAKYGGKEVRHSLKWKSELFVEWFLVISQIR